MVPSKLKLIQLSPMDVTTNLRRLPQQSRSRQRIEHVLATADRLLAEEGASALTTTRVAEAAGISVGSLYQWFPDRDAIAESLALRYLESFKQVMATLMPAEDPAGAALDAFAAAFRAQPGFRAMWFGGLRTETLRDVTRPGLQDITESLAEILRALAPDADPELVGDVSRMTVISADALLRHAFRMDPEGDEAILTEAKRMLRGYLNQRLGIPDPT
jgi:AcrR family transcriptional regulator